MGKKRIAVQTACAPCRATEKKIQRLLQDLAAARQNMERWQTLLQEQSDELERLRIRVRTAERNEELRQDRLQGLARVFVRQLMPRMTPIKFWQTVHATAASCGLTPTLLSVDILQAFTSEAAKGYADALTIARTSERNERTTP